LAVANGGGYTRRPTPPTGATSWAQPINWRNPWQIPKQDPRLLPGRILTPREERGWMPAPWPSESYESVAPRVFSGLPPRPQPSDPMLAPLPVFGNAQWLSGEQAAKLREQAFEVAGYDPVARHQLRTVPLYSEMPAQASGGWAAQFWPSTPERSPTIVSHTQNPYQIAHEYAHAWQFTRSPEERDEFMETVERIAREEADTPTHQYIRQLVSNPEAKIYAEYGKDWREEYYPRIAGQIMDDPSFPLDNRLARYFRGFFSHWPNLPMIWKNAWQ